MASNGTVGITGGIGFRFGWDRAFRLQNLHECRVTSMSRVMLGQKTADSAVSCMDDVP